MILLLLILIPVCLGVLNFFLNSKGASMLALLGYITTLVLSMVAYNQYVTQGAIQFSQSWIPSLGANFSFAMDSGLQILMVVLTALAFPLIAIASWNKNQDVSSRYHALMLLAQAGLMGVFLAKDALLFYMFWELALIPVYFLCSMYGGERRIPVTFKFFVYTFAGSLLLLGAILFIYVHTPIRSFAWNDFIAAGKSLSASQQHMLFWLMFTAFAIKMPIFPFHTWQPDAYEQSNTSVTIVLSAIMVKMGLFAVINWLMPVLPDACHYWRNVVMILSVTGIVYGSMLAMVQQNIKRLIAYSSIAHIGLMCAALFSQQMIGSQGVAIQMFNHGINIMGLWLLVQMVEHRLHTQNLNEMGGVAKTAPWFTIFLVLVSLANIALPLTNGFIGEFIMFNGLFNADSSYRIGLTIAAGLGVILSAVYTLTMIQKVAYGEKKFEFQDLNATEMITMVIIAVIILGLGFNPHLLMDLVNQQQLLLK